MKKFKIEYGLGGSFGMEEEEVETSTLDDAIKYAYESALMVYDSYEGSQGIPDICSIMGDDETMTEDEACIALEEEKESWISYNAQEI